MKNFLSTLLSLLNNMDLTKENKVGVGGYGLPADFQCITPSFLSSIEDLSYEERISTIYHYITGNDLPKNAFSNLNNAEFPASVASIDQGLSALELNDGENANYTDYIVNGDCCMEIVSFACVIISAYVDLVSGGIISSGEKINLAFNGEDGRLILSAYFLKLLKLPIEVLLIGTEKPIDGLYRGLYIQSPMEGEINTLVSGLYEDIDYLIDPLSAYGLVSYDLYYGDYEDDRVTLLLALTSPYLYARQVLKYAFDINEISVDKAVSKLNALTAVDIPSGILNKKLQPFFKINSQLSAKSALEIIKGCNKV